MSSCKCSFLSEEVGAHTYTYVPVIDDDQQRGRLRFSDVKGKMYPCTGTEALYGPYGP